MPDKTGELAWSIWQEQTAMKLFEKLFRPVRRFATVQALADFIDAQSAFIVQKGIYEYSRARAGHYAKVLFAEEGFAQSVEHARWQAFPLGLSMVGEMVDGVLASAAGMQRRANSRPADHRSFFRCSTAIRFRRRSAKRPGLKRAATLRTGSIWSEGMRPSA